MIGTEIIKVEENGNIKFGIITDWAPGRPMMVNLDGAVRAEIAVSDFVAYVAAVDSGRGVHFVTSTGTVLREPSAAGYYWMRAA